MYLQNLFSRLSSYLPAIRGGFKHAFSTGTLKKDSTLNEKELSLIIKLVDMIHRRKLTIPTTMFLESIQPLNYIGSQFMLFLRPFLTFYFSQTEYDLLQGIIEKRDGIKKIIDELEKDVTYNKDTKDN